MPTLEFKGKHFVHAHHLSVPFRHLVIDKKRSMPPKGGKPSLDENLIIHGDNLHALKALLPTYAGKIHCIYIDPPYNTGNEKWCYNDNVNSPLMREWLRNGAYSVDKEDLERHEKWLCMMWPRLKLLHELLAEDGVIFASIDDNEFEHLKCIMDEIFAGHHVATIPIVNNMKGRNDKESVAQCHEYLVVYSKGHFSAVSYLCPKPKKRGSSIKTPKESPMSFATCANAEVLTLVRLVRTCSSQYTMMK